MSWFASHGETASSSGFDLSRLLRRLVVLFFALVQLVLFARILLDLGVIPVDGQVGELIVGWSDTLAAPVQGLGSGLGSMFGGSGIEGMAGDGLDPVMLVALAGWSVVEGLAMRVVRKFDQE